MIWELWRVLPQGMRARGHLLSGERGASVVEYGLLAALIAAVIIAVVAVLGQNTSNLYSSANTGW